MIKFEKQTDIFYLNTKTTTYAMEVSGGQYLLHRYWGKRLKNPLDRADSCVYSGRNLVPFDMPLGNSDVLPLEYSSYGNADMRIPSAEFTFADDSRVTRLTYKGYEILDGKPALEGLPATYCEEGDKVQTLVIRLEDTYQNVDVFLSYSVFEDLDAITRSTKIVNRGDKVLLDSAMSATVDFYGSPEQEILHLDGAWTRERHITRQPVVYGNQGINSRYGCSSAFHNPFIAVCDKSSTENHGNVYGFNLVYSGNFTAGAERNPYNGIRTYIGINPIIMFIDYKSSSVRFTGRFAELNNTMTATAAGSAIEIAFKGDSILLKFDLADQKYPYPHLWMQLDGGAWIETQLDWYLRINANNTETHLAKIVLKSTLEMQERWNLPIVAKLSFVGAEVEETAVLPEDKRKTIEIIGDSITEGVLIDADKQPIEPETDCRTFQDDIFATYGYITAQNLNLRSYHVGYGAVGFTHGGCGNVPAVNNSYDYCFSGAPVTYGHPDFILINHGVNDTGWGADNYVHEYERFLKHLIEVHNTSKIIVLNNFRGSYKDETKEMVSRFNKEYGTDIFYIDSSGWVSFEPLHPLRDGHKIIAEHLIKILKEKYSL